MPWALDVGSVSQSFGVNSRLFSRPVFTPPASLSWRLAYVCLQFDEAWIGETVNVLLSF